MTLLANLNGNFPEFMFDQAKDFLLSMKEASQEEARQERGMALQVPSDDEDSEWR